MGLRKRPYNEEKTGRKGGEGKKPAKPFGEERKSRTGFGGEDKRKGAQKPSGKFGAEKKVPAKRSYKRSEGEDNRPARPAKKAGFSADGKRSGSFRPAGRPGADNGPYVKRPAMKNDEESPRSERPVKRSGFSGENRRSASTRSPERFGAEKGSFARRPNRKNDEGETRFERPAKRSGFTRRDDSRDEEPRQRVSKSGRPYMVKGAKARDIKAKSEEKLETLTPDEIRLNRYISNSGICSRREADDLIAAGLVAVNGTIVTEMGFKVKPGDEVRYNNERLSWEKKVYLLMNKPKDSITTSDDPEGRKIIMDLIKDPRLPRVYPVGRLDRNTTGVILLTNDGELAQRLTHPKYNISKVYKATLNKNFAAKDMQELANNGVELEDGSIKPDIVGIPSASEKNVVMIQIHSGRNRIIHRMFEAMGYLVDKLDRIDFAGLERKGLDRGEWRHLDDKEIRKLKKLVQLK